MFFDCLCDPTNNLFSLIYILSSSDNKGLDVLINNNYVLLVLTRTNCDYIVCM